MNLRLLQSYLSAPEELLLLDRSFSGEDCLGCVLGLARRGTEVTLYTLQYDRTYSERLADAEWSTLNDPPCAPATVREKLLLDSRGVEPRLAVETLRSMELGGVAYDFSGSSGGVVEMADWEKVLLLEQFLRAGWQPPEELAKASLERCFLTGFDLREAFADLSGFSPDGPLVLVPGSTSTSETSQLPLTLEIGKCPEEPVILRDDDGIYPVYLHRVALYDPWGEFREMYRQHRARPDLTEEQRAMLDRSEQNLLETLPGTCPEGMVLPVVEYECAEPISLEIRALAELDGPIPQPRLHHSPDGAVAFSSGLIIMVRPDEKTGSHGLPLRGCAVDFPVDPGTGIVPAELFRWRRTITKEPMTL